MTREGKRILVVDDDVGIQELLELALESEGYSVAVARDGVEALEKLPSWLPDIVILDLMMPRMDGYAFAKELRRVGLRNQVRILVLTAATRGRERAAAIDAEAYVDKPFSLLDFLREVARLAA